MLSALATITLGPSDKPGPDGYPVEGLHSFLYRFGDTLAGAWTRAADGSAICRPWAGQVKLEFIFAGGSREWFTDHVVDGAEFVVWYGGDIGTGQIDCILGWSDTRSD